LLKIAGDDPAVGFYFVPSSGDPTDIVVNNPAEVSAVIPALTAGAGRARITHAVQH
jgi:hypothetical protein